MLVHAGLLGATQAGLQDMKGSQEPVAGSEALLGPCALRWGEESLTFPMGSPGPIQASQLPVVHTHWPVLQSPQIGTEHCCPLRAAGQGQLRPSEPPTGH